MIQLTLYTTLGCHLCSQLEARLAALANQKVRLNRIEISGDDALRKRYGVRIPVLADSNGSELDQGFEITRLSAWLRSRGWLNEAALADVLLTEVSWAEMSRTEISRTEMSATEDIAPQAHAPTKGGRERNGRRFLN